MEVRGPGYFDRFAVPIDPASSIHGYSVDARADRISQEKLGSRPQEKRVKAMTPRAPRRSGAKGRRRPTRRRVSPPPVENTRDLRQNEGEVGGKKLVRDHVKHAAVWAVVTATAAAISIVVSSNADRLKAWFSAMQPLRVHVAADAQAPSSYSLVVPDPRRLSPQVRDARDCSTLWRLGVAAGGIQSGSSSSRVLVQGEVDDGVSIVDMRAKITRREPAIDGALLDCPSAGEVEPIRFQFDLSSSDSAQAQRFKEDSESRVAQFKEGYVISVAKNESVPLNILSILPRDAIYWHIEADALVAGERRTLTIDNEGKDFFSPGRRSDNQYRSGYGAGVREESWGVDGNAGRVRLPDGKIALRLGSAVFPDARAMDIYQPTLPELPEGRSSPYRPSSPYRWVRRDGRKLLEFNPDGVAARPLPRIGDVCSDAGPPHDGGPPWNDIDGRYGKIVSQEIVSRTERNHYGQRFEHLTIEYTCRLYHNEGDTTYRLWAAWGTGSKTIFVAFSNGLSSEDRAVTERLMNTVRLGR